MKWACLHKKIRKSVFTWLSCVGRNGFLERIIRVHLTAYSFKSTMHFGSLHIFAARVCVCSKLCSEINSIWYLAFFFCLFSPTYNDLELSS